MQMIKYIIPLLLIGVTCTSAFSLGSLFHTAEKTEDAPAVEEVEDIVEEEDEEIDEEEEDEEEEEEAEEEAPVDEAPKDEL